MDPACIIGLFVGLGGILGVDVGRAAEVKEGISGILCRSECGSSVGGDFLPGRDGIEGTEMVDGVEGS